MTDDPGRVAWLDRETANRRRLVHQRDDAEAASAKALSELTALQMRARHSHSITCDRCRSTIAVTSSLEIGADATTEALVVLTSRTGWRLSVATLGLLGVLVGTSQSSMADLCPACAKL